MEDSRGREFAHDPHRDIACRACHGTVTGHDTHRDIECAECHETPAFPEQASVPTAAECLACHHDPVRAEPCGRCHGLPADLPAAVVPVRIVAASPASSRTRALDFRHELHADLACEACHGSPPSSAEARDCAACHAEHHEPTRQCLACHTPLPLDTHSSDAHRGCGGSGCHDDAAVLSLPLTRAVCLACHQDQTAHEPGRECGPCHRIAEGSAVRPEDGSGS
jgi:DnaJ-class molecular chaperone